MIQSRLEKRSSFAMLMVALILLLPTLASATEYFVAKSGSDSNNGTTAPFLTIQKAVSVVQPGDIITVRPGVYSGPVTLSASGSATAKITLRAEFPALNSASSSRSVIAGSGASGTGLTLRGQHWIIEGLEVTKFVTGIMFSTGAHFGIARNNILRGNDGAGITCWECNDLLVEKNYFEDLGPSYPTLAAALQDYGTNFYYSRNARVVNNYFFGKSNHQISLKQNAFNSTIANNTFDGCMYACIELGQNPDKTAEGDLTSQGVTVENNIFRDAVDAATGAYYRTSVAITVMNVRDVVIRKNLFENIIGAGIKVYYDFSQGDIRLGLLPGPIKIHGNTMTTFRSRDPFSGEGGGSNAIWVQLRQRSSDDVIEVINNTFIGRPVYADAGTSVIQKNNLLNDTSQFVGPLAAYDPFANRGPRLAFTPDWSRNLGYRLISGSKYIDTGVATGLPYSGAAPDIGSNEFIPSIAAPAPSPTPAPAALTLTAGPIVSGITSSAATVTWYLSQPGTGQVQYGLTNAYGMVSSLESRLMDNHVQVLSNLTPGATYHYRVVSKNADGLSVYSPDKTFVTLGSAPNVDNTAPGVSITSPSNGSAIKRGSTIQIIAQASDNQAVVKVEFYVNGTLIGTRTSAPYSQSFTLGGRRGLNYSIQTKAYDAAGNTGISPVVSIRTSR